MSKLMNVITLMVILTAFMMAFYTYTENRPFRLSRTLPEIEASDVSEVIMDYSFDGCSGCEFDGSVAELTAWFNEARELKTEVGTTSDCRMTVKLHDGSEIYIWNMYKHDMVTVGYRKGDHYYQTNVYSDELGDYFYEFREKKVAQQDQGAWAY